MKINVALFGLGRVGIMHAADISSHPKFNLKYVFDINRSALQSADSIFHNALRIIPLAARQKQIIRRGVFDVPQALSPRPHHAEWNSERCETSHNLKHG